MSRKSYIFTSESVSEGHPDKVCDRISDAVLDAFIALEPEARVACETFATTNRVVVGGEVGLSDKKSLSKQMGKIDDIVRACIKDIGYEQKKFHHETVEITNLLHEQSAHIAQGVNADGEKEEGAGDQGIMFGYATDETPDLMPAPIQYSHAVLRRLAEVRKSGAEPSLGPDAKSQLSVRYENGFPVGITSIVLSTQHLDASLSSEDIRAIVEPYILETLPTGWVDSSTSWHVNPTGKFVIGGPDGDAGLTGRKIIVDTYGGWAKHGGGAFSGKDPSKVDRSACYMARYLAKNIVASGLLPDCEIQLAYAIGKAEPVSFNLTSTLNIKSEILNKLSSKLFEIFDCTPKGIIDTLDLLNPIYENTASYGHFGRDEKGFSWENTDKKEEIKSL